MAAAIASPPSSQNMVSSPSLSPPRQQSDDSSTSPDRMSRVLSFSKNADSQSSELLRSEEYRQLFRLPADEVLLQDFNCALQENILLQGHMYLFEHYICFYSNIFGFETKKIIAFQDVTCVRRAKTAGIFPNAIEIATAEKRHVFASFLSRDDAFKLISDGWSQQGNDPKGILDQQDSKSESSSQLNVDFSAEIANSDSAVNDLDSDERNLEDSTSEATKQPTDHLHDSSRLAVSEGPDVMEAKKDVAKPFLSQPINWNLETEDAPEIPENYTKVAESKFTINVEQFFNLFISDDSVGFVKSFHNKCGDRDLKCTSWIPLDKFGYTREKSFQHPVKIYFGAKCGGCKETQKLGVYKDSHLVIKTSQEVSDVPYADYFTVEGIWDVQRDAEQPEGCTLQVFANVDFSKKTMWKGKIEQSTMEECREVFRTWIELAHELLMQKNIEKPEEGAIPSIQDDQVDQQVTGQSEQRSESLQGIAEPCTNDTVANSWGTHEQIGEKLRGKMLHAATTIMSASRAIAMKLFTSLRNLGNLQLFLVIAFSIILLLMQISIVLLLSRPQPVYLIPQADHTSPVGFGAGNRAAEAMAWMEKRVHLLKDEMLAVEAQLERMRREHNSLKTQLKDLEHMHRQQR